MDVLDIATTVVAIILAGALVQLFRALGKRLPKKDVFMSNYSGGADIHTTDGRPLRSEHSYTKTEIEFENRLTGPVDIYWINYQGGRQKYYTLPPNQTRRQQTFVTHPWIVEKVSTGEEVRRIVVDVSVGRVIITDE